MSNHMDDKLKSALLSACTTIAAEEGITDETEAIARANEVFMDAQKPDPETDAGKKAVEKAQTILVEQEKDNVVSQFDYDAYRDQISVPAVKEMLVLFGQYADKISPLVNIKPLSDEEGEAMFKSFHQMSIDAFKILNENKISMSKYEYIFKKIKEVVSYLEEIQAQQLMGHRGQVLSYIYGAKNPGTGKPDANYATYADLLTARENIIKQAGNEKALDIKDAPSED